MMARHAEKLPDGPARKLALDAMIRLANEAADAHDRQLAEERNAMRRDIRDLAVRLTEHAQHGHRPAMSDPASGIISNPLILPAIVVAAAIAVLALYLSQ